MKKVFLSIALVTASFFAFNASASTNSEAKAPKTDFFEGITLSADQQQAVADLKTKRAEARKADKEARKADKEARKATRNQDRKARMEARKARMIKAKEGRRAYLKDVQAILTPDQYVVFLENIAVSNLGDKQGCPKMKKQGKKHAHRHGHKNSRMKKTAENASQRG